MITGEPVPDEREPFYMTTVTPDQFLSWIRRVDDNTLPDSIPHYMLEY